MYKIFPAVALIGLLLSAAAPLLTFLGVVDEALNRTLMAVGMLLWFVGATPWLGQRKLRPADSAVEI